MCMCVFVRMCSHVGVMYFWSVYRFRAFFQAMRSPAAHETAIKVGGYIVGEFGGLIENQARYYVHATALHVTVSECLVYDFV